MSVTKNQILNIESLCSDFVVFIIPKKKKQSGPPALISF